RGGGRRGSYGGVGVGPARHRGRGRPCLPPVGSTGYNPGPTATGATFRERFLDRTSGTGARGLGPGRLRAGGGAAPTVGPRTGRAVSAMARRPGARHTVASVTGLNAHWKPEGRRVYGPPWGPAGALPSPAPKG